MSTDCATASAPPSAGHSEASAVPTLTTRGPLLKRSARMQALLDEDRRDRECARTAYQLREAEISAIVCAALARHAAAAVAAAGQCE